MMVQSTNASLMKGEASILERKGGHNPRRPSAIASQCSFLHPRSHSIDAGIKSHSDIDLIVVFLHTTPFLCSSKLDNFRQVIFALVLHCLTRQPSGLQSAPVCFCHVIPLNTIVRYCNLFTSHKHLCNRDRTTSTMC